MVSFKHLMSTVFSYLPFFLFYFRLRQPGKQL